MERSKYMFLRLNLPELRSGESAPFLRKVHPDVLKKAADGGERLWYQGPEPYFDLFFDLEPTTGSLRWFQFTYRGQAVTWDERSGRLELGVTGELDIEDHALPATRVILPGGEPEFVQTVLEVLETRPDDALFAQASRAVRRATRGAFD